MARNIRTSPSRALALLGRPKPAENRRSAEALLEFQSPTAAMIARPIPASGRAVIWTIAAAVSASIVLMGVCPVDRVVPVAGKVVANVPNIAVQPLDQSVVRAISVKEGQLVHKGQLLLQLDPTVAAADLGASEAQAASLQAEVNRLTAEAQHRPYLSDGSPASELQAMIFTERHAELTAKRESYQQKIDSAKAKIAETASDIQSYAEQYKAAAAKEEMRRQLEQLHVGSKLNTLESSAQRAEATRALQTSLAADMAAKSDLQALMAERDAFVQQTETETGQELAQQERKLADARDALKKARLHRRLIDLRADRDAIVLNVAKMSVGSVVRSGDDLVTMVPADAPLSVEAGIPAREAGFVGVGNPVVIKFDTFPYTTYGYAKGTLTRVSADSFTDPQAARERPTQSDPAQTVSPATATYYRASVSIDTLQLHHLPSGFRMTPGMPVTADIKVGQRTVLSYLLSRIAPVLTQGMREP